jgi:Tfp pilus assembly protein PilX
MTLDWMATMKTSGLNHQGGNQVSSRGGITILAVLALLVLATVTCFALGRASIRELAVTGTVWQGAKASEAAEAGLDWFILWANPDNSSLATNYRRNDLLSAFQQLNQSGTWQTNTYHTDPDTITWDRSAQITSTEKEGDASPSDMVFANSGTGFSQSSATTGNRVVQSFDVSFRYLGAPMNSGISSGVGNPAGPGSNQTGRSLILYQVDSTGKASIPTSGEDYVRYLANREAYIVAVP